LVAEAVCKVDRGDSKYIDSPYGSQPTTVVQTIAGTYSTATYTLSDDLLTVTDEFVVAEHVYDWEDALTTFDVFANRIDEQNNSVKTAIDKWVLNELCEGGTGTYSTPSGGFTAAANIIPIFTNLLSKVAGYADGMKGTYLVVENTDLPGILTAQAGNGFSMADSALKNGLITNYMTVDVYVIRTATFVDATTTGPSGTKTWTNDGHRVFGVKGVSTYAAPRGVKYEEKGVTGKTGMEVVTFGYVGFKQWTPTATLTVDITLTA